MSKKILIVGGVAGGASAAARLRRLDEKAIIILFERGPYISYANCGLPYYIGGEIKDREALLVQTAEDMKAKYNIDVRIMNEVIKIDRKNKTVTVKDKKTGEVYTETYDKLILSPGSTPAKPPIPGIDAPNIFTLWTVPDTDSIKAYIDNNRIEHAVVVGGGFIGIEMTENLRLKGFNVSLVEIAEQVMAPLDYDMAQIVHKNFKDNGVNLYLGEAVKEFSYKDKKTEVFLSSGKKLIADIIILSAGVKPNTELAERAGLKLNWTKGIVTNEYMQTEDPDIYAIGDAVQVKDFVSGQDAMIPLAGPANKMGRIVANNICGIKEKYKGTQGTSVIKIFDMTAACTGQNEKLLKKAGKRLNKDYRVTIIHPQNHAGYYPGGTRMTLKLIFSLNGKVLGAQAVGYDGVDKRIDVLATAIRFNATVYDLKELELAYAPPYSSAKDPVNMAGFTAENILKGIVDVVLPSELESLSKDDIVFLDVREPEEFELGTIPGAVNIPLSSLRGSLGKLDKNKTYIAFCAVGIRSYMAVRILMQNGFKAKNLAGAYTSYETYFGDFTSKNDSANLKKDLRDKDISSISNLNESNILRLDCSGMQCPGPIIKVYNTVKEAEKGQIIEVHATDPGFCSDSKSWCEKTGNTFIKSERRDKEYVVWIKKGNEQKDCIELPCGPASKENKTFVVFSSDLDKAIAAFIIANGALAMGKKVTMFFTFWGLNIIRKPEKVRVKKSFIEKMFAFMMPRGVDKLGLSKMNMAGIGAKMIKSIMKKKNVSTLSELISQAKKNGVRIVACTMSMDLMGIKEEELIDGIDFGGVGSYLGAAEDANLNLFI